MPNAELIHKISRFASCIPIRHHALYMTIRMCSTDSGQAALSSVHRGTAFENRTMLLLRHLSMSLSRVGGRNDGGIDLQGWWWLPNASSSSTVLSSDASEPENYVVSDSAGVHRRRIRVLAQCKAERKKLGPNYVREMEGVLHRHLHTFSNENEAAAKTIPTVALLASESAFTKATVVCALSSPLPFFLLHLPRVSPSLPSEITSDAEHSEDPELFASAIWNPALGGQKGVLGGEIDLRWELSQDPATPRRPSLWWHGIRLQSWVPLLEP